MTDFFVRLMALREKIQTISVNEEECPFSEDQLKKNDFYMCFRQELLTVMQEVKCTTL